ncbi:uncharacterized protein LOC107026859 isoform X1 [Solanum pennellii]|uniref:Uncharacterized protein LOC107026859 isoform X1 n=1 Tax=Solanum pennellii TaxID=28526 RepID=A0ABM1HCA6_SOLPN|nr:uncharacterized protein LOC107026859 isoform X1 [Solanum pennellii]XP_015083446.1 uncharacterized protein LOC107026859 isoform X1 [Solanum pennellii]XP_015083447.1 uncharacterized protein LOC107026859 isoform X1 [Solanum pennellii]XP_015083448.1 uncharacterized protein LOC107026859 isoform X1 [Solanum pennellii]
MVRGRDACWEHCVLVDATKQKVRCNYCRREFSGGVYRMKFHLAQIKNKDIVPCGHVPNEVRDHIKNILNNPKKQKNPKKAKLDQAANGQESSSSSASGGIHPPHDGFSGQNGSPCPPSIMLARRSSSSQPAVDDVQKQKQDNADKKIAEFFYHNAIPFSVTKSFYYQEMVDAILECKAGYKAPCTEELGTKLLEKVKVDIDDGYKRLRDEWKETGCTILCDCWSDGRAKCLVVFSVTCSKGTMFLRSVDVSDHADDPHYLFGLLESVVLEIGVENVVQVMTDSSASYIYAGRLVMKKYPSVFWSPCASHCINKMLEDFSEHDWVNVVLKEANMITKYIYSNDWMLDMMRKFSGEGEFVLVRPRFTNFVAIFLSLRALVIQEDNLKHMFSHAEWLSSIYSRHPEVQAIKSLLCLERFWRSAREAVTVSEPLLKLLRIVDGDMPAMAYMYDGVERAKLSIKAFYKDVDEKFVPIWDIIDRRWSMLLQSPLHAAAAFLNPSIFYNSSFKIDARIRNGFQEAMTKMASEDKDKVEITKEHPMYINAQGALGTEFAIKGRTLNAPADWWTGYGYEIPTLQRAAIRILSQPCSLHWCRWDWSTFDGVHEKRRERLELDRFNDLVYVHCNLWLRALIRNKYGKWKPINFDEIDVGAEWPTEAEVAPCTYLDDSWLQLAHFTP